VLVPAAADPLPAWERKGTLDAFDVMPTIDKINSSFC